MIIGIYQAHHLKSYRHLPLYSKKKLLVRMEFQETFQTSLMHLFFRILWLQWDSTGAEVRNFVVIFCYGF